MRNTLIGGLALMVVLPVSAEARYRGEVSGWVPWFGEEAAIEEAIDHMREFDTLYLFTFEVLNDGSLRNLADFESDEWEELFDEARDHDVKLIPTITWFDAAPLHFVLDDRRQRNDHIEAIVDMVDEYDFDGIDIDYEGKWPKSKENFSRFLHDLKDELGRRQDLVCTVESHTPPKDLYNASDQDKAGDFEYATDYSDLDRYCDRVQIMAYDQQRADITLNNERKGVPYAPVADIEWVEKVMEVALEDIDEDKLVLGIPTYGRAWDVTVAPDWYRDYKSVAALNHARIEELIDIYDANVGRTEGGEAVISYFPEDSIWSVLNAFKMPEGTPAGFERAALALLLANATGKEIPVRVVIWSDAKAMEQKLELAEELDLAGAAFFSIHEKIDQDIWKLF